MAEQPRWKKTFCNLEHRWTSWVDAMDEDEVNSLGRRLLRIANTGLGAAYATLDTITTGYPVFSVGIPVHSYLQFVAAAKHRDIYDTPSIGEQIKLQLCYWSGTAVPFAIKYRREISSFVEAALQ